MIKEKINNSEKGCKKEEELRKELKRFDIVLSTETKMRFVNMLKKKPFHIEKDEAKENYIVGRNLIPNEGRARKLFDEVKKECVHCHVLAKKAYCDTEEDNNNSNTEWLWDNDDHIIN